MKTLKQDEFIELESLIDDARLRTRIVEILSNSLISEGDHENGHLIDPLDEDDEAALTTAILDAGQSARKLYEYFHKTVCSA
jgi:hypothetical protein